MKLTPHEEKILNIIKGNPGIIDNPDKRATVAKKHGLTEKTLRNRIAELKKRGLVKVQKGAIQENKKPLITDNDEININVIGEILLKKRSFVSKFSLVCTLAGLTYSLFATIYFESKISLYPAG